MRDTFHVSIFLLTAGLVLFGFHYYIWARLVRDMGLKAFWRLAASLALAVMGCLIILGILFARGNRFFSAPEIWAIFTWMGMALLMCFLLAVADVMKLLAVTIPSKIQKKPLNPERREFLARATGGAVLLADFFFSGVALWGASAEEVRVKRISVILAQLPLDGYRLAQITDVHVGEIIGRKFVRTVVDEVNALKPNLIAITGDLVDGTVARLKDKVAPLADLRAPDGVFFVTGNHEYYNGDLENWLAWLEGAGIRTLHNERLTIRNGFDLAGTEDISAHGYGQKQDIPQALSGRKGDKPVILMAHQPRSFDEAQKWGVDLQLSGHTHGGQIFPFSLIVSLFQPYLAGFYRKGSSQLYVSRGTGYWGPPMRLGSPAEITEITLKRG
jgi:predicted MPP superfamily phosphohydrolase